MKEGAILQHLNVVKRFTKSNTLAKPKWTLSPAALSSSHRVAISSDDIRYVRVEWRGENNTVLKLVRVQCIFLNNLNRREGDGPE